MLIYFIFKLNNIKNKFLKLKMDNKNILVVITANNCGACKLFKPKLEDARKEIEERVVLVHIALSDMNTSTIPSTYPKDLNNYRRWYPMLILINRNIWNNAMNAIDDGSIKLNGLILGGKKSGDSPPEQEKSKYSWNITSLLEWIDDMTPQLNNLGTKSKNENVPTITSPTKGKPLLNIPTNSSFVKVTTLQTTDGPITVETEKLIKTCETILTTRRNNKY